MTEADKARGRRIKESREARNLTQEDLAARAGVRSGTVSRYETGNLKPSAESLLLMAEALDVSPQFLMFGEEPKMRAADSLARARAARRAVDAFLASSAGRHVTEQERIVLLSMRDLGEVPPTPEVIRAILAELRLSRPPSSGEPE